MNLKYVLGILLAVMLLFAIGCKKEEAAASPETAPEAGVPADGAPADEAAAEGAPAQEALAETPKDTEATAELDSASKETAAASSVDIVSETTTTGTAYGREKAEGSWFSGVSCTPGEEKGTVSFTFTNKGKEEYSIGHVTAMERTEKRPIVLSVNGRNLKDVKKECNLGETGMMKPGESIKCTVNVMVRTGQSYQGRDLTNDIEATGSGMNSKLVFKC